MVREMFANRNNGDRVCCKCNREIKMGEKYYRTGKMHQNRTHRSKGVTARGMGIRNYCVDCINSIYVDGDDD